jgi:hypothetical protein
MSFYFREKQESFGAGNRKKCNVQVRKNPIAQAAREWCVPRQEPGNATYTNPSPCEAKD